MHHEAAMVLHRGEPRGDGATTCGFFVLFWSVRRPVIVTDFFLRRVLVLFVLVAGQPSTLGKTGIGSPLGTPVFLERS